MLVISHTQHSNMPWTQGAANILSFLGTTEHIHQIVMFNHFLQLHFYEMASQCCDQDATLLEIGGAVMHRAKPLTVIFKASLQPFSPSPLGGDADHSTSPQLPVLPFCGCSRSGKRIANYWCEITVCNFAYMSFTCQSFDVRQRLNYALWRNANCLEIGQTKVGWNDGHKRLALPPYVSENGIPHYTSFGLRGW